MAIARRSGGRRRRSSLGGFFGGVSLGEFANEELKRTPNPAHELRGLRRGQSGGAVAVGSADGGGLAQSGGERFLEGGCADVRPKDVGSSGFEGRSSVGAAGLRFGEGRLGLNHARFSLLDGAKLHSHCGFALEQESLSGGNGGGGLDGASGVALGPGGNQLAFSASEELVRWREGLAELVD